MCHTNKKIMWQEQNNQLVKDFTFKGFSQAADFIGQIAREADKMEHHPDVLLHGYNKLHVTLMTHDVGKITDKDHKLASIIDELYEKV